MAMLLAQAIPTDPEVDTTEFAFTNFHFCVSGFITASLSQVLGPFLKVFQQQLDITQPISQVLNHLRDAAKSLLYPATKLFQIVWDKFRILTYQVLRIFAKIASSLDRIFGIAISSVFMGMGLWRGIMNSVGFAIRVAIVLIIILSILVVLLWFIMWPVIPVILTMIGFISATAYAGDVAGVSGSFCIAPETLVAMKGGWKRADQIQPGDTLDKEGVVEGVLNAKGGACVCIDGVVISDNHLVSWNDTWIPAGMHPNAKKIRFPPDRLICLNTSFRVWRVKANSGSTHELLLRDWEELPEDPTVDAEWETLIAKLLGQPLLQSAPGRGLLGEWATVWKEEEGPVQIRSIRVGDYVRDGDGSYTEVLAVYHDTSEFVPISGPNASAWVWSGSQWIHPEEDKQVCAKDGWHLITQSGTFQAGTWIVRDFTEVGIHKLPLTSSFVMQRLPN